MLETQGIEAVKNFCICNAFKYLYRHCGKNGLEDVKKAGWYIWKYIELEEGAANENREQGNQRWMPELLGSPAMRTVPSGSWNWQTAWERSRNDYLPVRASGKMQKVIGYCQVVKAQDFDSCIPGSNPGSLVGGFGVSPEWIFSIVWLLLSPLAESWLKSRRKARWGFRFRCGSFLGVK